MPPDRSSSQDMFNISVLDAQALDTPDGLDSALRTIEAVCHQGGDPEIARMVAELEIHSFILEYIISGMLRPVRTTSADNFAFQYWRRGRSRSSRSG